ncbi:MAG: hemolysin family protein [Actinomycetota bacterium]|nr:hemolysin family protein [Actinomycetota bacterium]
MAAPRPGSAPVTPPSIALAVALVLLVLAAALRAAGASLVGTPRADALRDAAEGDDRAALVADLLEDRLRVQPSLTMVHSALLVAAGLAAAWTLSRVAAGWPLATALVALGLVLVLLGEVLPRQWGRIRPRWLAYRLAPLLDQAIRFGGRATDLIEEEDQGAEEEDAGEADSQERELISSVLEFSDAVVHEVMVPRTDMVTVPSEVNTDQALDVVIAHGFSRVPVHQGGPDDIVGIVYAKDLLRLMDLKEDPKPVMAIMRSPYFVPETKRVGGLLREMQANKVHMALVVDEFGGTAGLVTIEDLLEELVGEIVDEYDTEEPMAVPQRDGSYLVDARMPVDQLGQLLGVELPEGDWDTVGGLVLGLAGRVPREGESFEFDQTVIVPDRVQGRRVARVRVKRR